MLNERFYERFADFNKALTRLQEALALQEDDIIRDSIIQRFEFTYELSWKTMRLWLQSKDIDVRNAKDTLAEALTQGILDDGSLWSKIHEMRNLSSHTYDESLAKEMVTFLKTSGFAALQTFQKKMEMLSNHP